MNDKEKLEAIQQILDEISSKQRNYLDDTSLLDYFERQIKKILESVDFGFDGGLDTRLRKLH